MRKSHANTFRPAVTAFEDRLTPAISLIGTTIVFVGDDAAQTATVYQSGSRYIAVQNAETRTFPVSSATKVSFHGHGGNDTFENATGLEGWLEGGAGADNLYGGWGRDTVQGGPGPDTLNGGFGNDEVYANYKIAVGGDASGDVMSGGDGQDTLHGSAGPDTLNGGLGEDYLFGHLGWDRLYANTAAAVGGDASYNYLNGGSDYDILYGSDGPDFLDGARGTDYLYGNGGDDQLYANLYDPDAPAWYPADTSYNYLGGGAGTDSLYGGDGGDYLDGGIDNKRDVMYGGLGADTFRVETIFWGIRLDFVGDYNSAQGDRILT